MQTEDDYALYYFTFAELESEDGPLTADEINFGTETTPADSEGDDDEIDYPF